MERALVSLSEVRLFLTKFSIVKYFKFDFENRERATEMKEKCCVCWEEGKTNRRKQRFCVSYSL
jgi:hypothetical protein